MTRWVVDTNVPIVANGRPDSNNRRPPSIQCREAAIMFLQKALELGKIFLDLAGEIQDEYRKYLNPHGQPGVGDRFYLSVLRSDPHLVERIKLPKRTDGEHADLPQRFIDICFDRSDRKFVALAKRASATIVNATDSDWLSCRDALDAEGIALLCVFGFDKTKWFESPAV